MFAVVVLFMVFPSCALGAVVFSGRAACPADAKIIARFSPPCRKSAFFGRSCPLRGQKNFFRRQRARSSSNPFGIAYIRAKPSSRPWNVRQPGRRAALGRSRQPGRRAAPGRSYQPGRRAALGDHASRDSAPRWAATPGRGGAPRWAATQPGQRTPRQGSTPRSATQRQASAPRRVAPRHAAAAPPGSNPYGVAFTALRASRRCALRVTRCALRAPRVGTALHLAPRAAAVSPRIG